MRNIRWSVLTLFAIILISVSTVFATTSPSVVEKVDINDFGWTHSHERTQVRWGYLAGSDKLYIELPSNVKFTKFDWWFETASNVWDHNMGTDYTYKDSLDSNLQPDLFTVTLTGADTAGGIWYLETVDFDGI